MKDWFTPTAQNLFISKNDPQDPRLGEIIKTISATELQQLSKKDFTLLSYPDDEGVKKNGGRPGAAEAPLEIKKVLYKMTPGLSSKFKGKIFDLGNLTLSSQAPTLDEKHSRAQNMVLQCLKKESRVITLGGGHDYAYPDLTAFCTWAQSNKKRPFIINFDAHLDVRPDDNGMTSGTGFRRLLKEFPKIDFFEVGIQDWCNSKEHCDWAEKKGAKILFLNQLFNGKLEKAVTEKVLKKFNPKKNELAISIDIDGFCSAAAPGASQVFPLGIRPHEFLPLFNKMVAKYSPKFLGIYEVNPQFDQDHRTAKLAAILVHQMIFGP